MWLVSVRVCVHVYVVWVVQHWELYGQRLWDGREDDGVKELKKNDRWLDHRKSGSGDWAWNEKKQGLDHAWHCKLWQETGAMGKLWRALSMIKNASLPPSLIHITHKINKKNICVQKPLGTVLYFRHHPIKTGSYSYSGFCAQPWQNNSRRDFFFYQWNFHLLLWSVHHRVPLCSWEHKCIWSPCRHQEGTKFPAGPIRLVKCLFGAFVVFLELVESHLYGDKWENQ